MVLGVILLAIAARDRTRWLLGPNADQLRSAQQRKHKKP